MSCFGKMLNVRSGRTRSALRATLVAGTLAAGVLAPANASGFQITGFDGEARTPAGAPETQAGAHADVTTTLDFATFVDGRGNTLPDGNVKSVAVELPPGLIGNPSATPKCNTARLASGPFGSPQCPDESQIGIIEIINGTGQVFVPVYNMNPPPNLPAQFAFNVAGATIRLDARVLPRGRTLQVTIRDISQTVPIFRNTLTFWGVPSDPVHDPQRGSLLFPPGIAVLCGSGSFAPCKSNAEPRPFMSNPTDCSAGPLTTYARADSWQQPGVVSEASFVSHLPDRTLTGVTGCDRLSFDARLDAQPSGSARAGQPFGLAVKLSIEQDDNPTGLATPPLKKALVTLPEGVVVSPSGANGLGACSSSQIGLDDLSAPGCPEASKIGDVTIDTPLLDSPMTGSVYLASQNDNPFRSLLAMYIVAQGPGVMLKLPGEVDLSSGRVVATFDNNPQLPFSQLRLNFWGGDAAPISLPPSCGAKTTMAELTSWGGQTVTSASTFNLSYDGAGAPCPPRGFAPMFRAGVTNASAGKDATFSLTFGRGDWDAELSDIAVDMPKGLLAKIADVELCEGLAAGNGTCPEASRIGTVTTGAGPGPRPFFLGGRAYMTGPYKGAPFGLSIVVPAVAGPLDLGVVVVRAAIFVDRETAALRIASDPLPQALSGIPLQVRLVNVAVDRPRFMFNPSNCSPTAVNGVIRSTSGVSANVSSRFQVGDCASLRYKPRMSIRMGARGRTRAGITAPVTVSLAMTPGQANNRTVRVNLPRNVNARLQVINRNSCSLEQFKGGTCPRSLRVGQAVAVTPLLKDPLNGDVFFVRNPARRIPDLMVALRGQVDVDLTGKVTIPRNLTLSTAFDTVPDVPITRFTMRLVAGRSGPVGFVANACTTRARSERARLEFKAHSGKIVRVEQRLSIVGCRKATARRQSGRRSGRTSPRRSAAKK